MPVVDKDDISVGLGTVEFGVYAGDVFQSYRDVGVIKSNLNIEHNREVLDFESGRPLVVIKQEVIRESVTITLTLSEINVAILKDALGQGAIGSGSVPTFLDSTDLAPYGTLQPGKTSVASGEILKFGGIPTHSYIGLRFTHLKSNLKRIIFEGFKASPMGSLSLPFNESEWNLTQVQFRLLADTNKPGGEQYYQLFFEK